MINVLALEELVLAVLKELHDIKDLDIPSLIKGIDSELPPLKEAITVTVKKVLDEHGESRLVR